MKVEESTGEKVSAMSALLRMCLNRTHVPFDDGKDYFKTDHSPRPNLETLPEAIAKMSDAAARRRVTEMGEDDYQERP